MLEVEEGRESSYPIYCRALYALRPEILKDDVPKGFLNAGTAVPSLKQAVVDEMKLPVV